MVSLTSLHASPTTNRFCRRQSLPPRPSSNIISALLGPYCCRASKSSSSSTSTVKPTICSFLVFPLCVQEASRQRRTELQPGHQVKCFDCRLQDSSGRVEASSIASQTRRRGVLNHFNVYSDHCQKQVSCTTRPNAHPTRSGRTAHQYCLTSSRGI